MRLRKGPALSSGDRVHIDLPASKSISNRLLLMRALSKGRISLGNLSTADDTRYFAEALTAKTDELWFGDGGTAMRFGLAWAAVTPGERILSGSHRLSERPVAPLVEALRQLGAKIEYLDKPGFLPLKVAGCSLNVPQVAIDASVSSQFTSALMMIGPTIAGGLEIRRDGPRVSEPYVEMTARLMAEAGVSVEIEGDIIRIRAGEYQPIHFEVEPDWSAASYFYALVALSGKCGLFLDGLQQSGLQGDEILVELYSGFGVDTQFEKEGALLVPHPELRTLYRYDFIDCPDLAQTAAVTAAGLKLPFRLEGLQTLRHKETDRIAALKSELEKCGAFAEAGTDYLEISHFADKPQKWPLIKTYGDHRMAMAFAPLAILGGGLSISSPDVVSKSFPGFWRELAKCGLEGTVEK